MKLIYLKLLNFRKFKEEVIEFWDSFSVIFWKNWAWKSSVIDGIGYALFWPVWKDFSRWNKEWLKSFFADSKAPSKIELCFDIWWIEYRIVRVIDKWTKAFESDFIEEKEDCLLYSWEKIVWWGEINSFVEKLIWVSRDVFLRSVFAKQKDIQVLSWDSKDRKKLINTILGIDKLEGVVVSYNREKLDNEAVYKSITNDIESFDVESLNNELENIKLKLSEVQNLKKSLLLQRKKIEDKKNIVKADYDKILAQKNEFSLLNSQQISNSNSISSILKKIDLKEKLLLDLESKKNYFDSEKKKFEIFDKEKAEISIIEAERLKYNQKLTLEWSLENLKRDFISNSSNFEEICNEHNFSKIEELDLKIKDCTECVEQTADSITLLLNKISKISSINDIIAQEWKKLWLEKKRIEDLSSDATCPTCYQTLWEHLKALLESYDSQIIAKRLEYKKNTDEISSLNSKKDLLEKNKADSQIILKRYTELKNKVISLSSKSEEIRKNIDDVNIKIKEIWEINFDANAYWIRLSTLKSLESEVFKLRSLEWELKSIPTIQEEIKTLNIELGNFKKELQIIVEKINNLDFKEEIFIQTKEKYDSFDLVLKSNFEELNNKNSEEASLKTDQNLIEERLKQNEKNKEKLSQIILFLEEVSIKIDIIKRYKSYLLSNLKPRLEDLASYYFAITTDNKYASIELTDDYLVKIEGKSIDIYSWGEQDLANFCLRLALSQNLTRLNSWNHINFIILDEVLWSQDETRRWNILNALKKIENKFSQVILISHMDEVKDIATNLIEVESISKNQSQIFVK